ncbi:L,D-transpeptidase family protein [Natroniella sulfidigena]|uniref:L,D-transpeptidase family protein n=1 Tax=Natroniella sulfidigena TaxID=723921 RepID=UPI00200B0BDE|nr:L,D-transpeptidase family protein [Natroniella sulfidigena]MCK8817040.1 L,D-transpeptidase family protein [Natroniella sulfidigena]
MAKILIVLNERRLYLLQNNQVTNNFPVAIGKQATPTPTGNYKIINKIKHPSNPALGTRWMQFTNRMHGIHGTNNPASIGTAASLGCVRMYNRDAEYLYEQVEVGTPIEIRQQQTNSPDNNSNYYTVQPGDTLYQIAKKFNTTVQELVRLNNLTDQNLIYPGQRIKIPN